MNAPHAEPLQRMADAGWHLAHAAGVGSGLTLSDAVPVFALVAVRISGLFLLAPMFSSAGIPARVKVSMVLAMAWLMTPVLHTAPAQLGAGAVLGELGVGLTLGLCLLLLMEAVGFAAALLNIEFSFSLVNLIDPMTHVETAVLGQMLSWFTVLVLLGAGLHRTLLAAVLRSFDAVPVGSMHFTRLSAVVLVHGAETIFIAGVQLAAPVIAAGMLAEVTIALVSRLNPQLPAFALSVPVKSLVSYGVLIAALAAWPGLIESRFTALLDTAQRVLVQG